MKSKIFIPLISLVGLFSLLCVWNDYRVDPMPNLTQDEGKRGITISSKVYDAEESKKYLSSDLLSRGYQPIQITIHNETATPFSIGGVDVPQAPAKEIARKISKSAIPRSVGYKIASLFFWPFAIPSTIDGVKTLHSHSRLSKDLAAKAIKEEKLSPFSTLHRIVFVRLADLREHLTLTLIDEKSGKVEDFKMALS